MKVYGAGDSTLDRHRQEFVHLRRSKTEFIDRLKKDRDATQHGALFATYLHPDVGAVWDPVVEDARSRLDDGRAYDRFALERRVGEELTRRGVVFLPLVAEFAGRQERGPFHLLPRDPHCNASGYRLEAELLAEFLLAADGLGLSARPRTGSGRSAPADPLAPPTAPAAGASSG